MPLHVLQLGPYPPPEGGITHNILAVREELHARGHRCSIIATTRSSEIREEPDVYHPRSAAALLKLLSRLDFDILHLHVGGDINRRVLALAAACGHIGRGRNVLTVHSGAFPLTDQARKASPASVRGRIFRSFSKLIAVNDPIADVFRRSGVPDESVRVILPFALRLPDPDVESPFEIARFYQEHSPVLIAVGGLEPDYDPLLQIAAIRRIRETLANAGLLIVGGGSMRAEVERAVADNGLEEHVMLAGNVDHAVTLHLINRADVLLRTTLFDGDAISVREALFLGTPVIATATGMRPDGVRLVPIGDLDALVHGIGAALLDEKARVAAEGDASHIKAVVDIYEGLAAANSSE